MAITREQITIISASLAAASVTGIGLALGGPIGATILGGIGINLSSSIIQHGAIKLKEKWFGSTNGILNHDIQHALVRGFVKSLESLEKKYFVLHEANELSKEKKNAIKSLFQELKGEAQTVFLPSIETSVKKQDIKSLLYGDPEQAQNALWERVEGTKLIYTYYGEHFKIFLRDNISDEIVFWFGEELKTDDKENNKAWRAFQRMLLEGIQADVESIKAGQDEIKHDLKALAKIRKQLLELKGALDHRLPNEPFQHSFVTALNEIKTGLQDVAKDTRHLRGTADVIAAGVKKLLSERTKAKTHTKPQPKLPKKIEKLLEKAKEIRNDSKLREAGEIYVQALELAEKIDDQYAIARCKLRIGSTLNDQHEFPEEALKYIRDAETYFRENSLEKELASALYESSVSELKLEGFDNARIHLKEALDIYLKLNDKFHEAACYFLMGWMEHGQGRLGRSKELYRKAIDIFEDQSTKEEQKIISARIGACYAHIALVNKAEINPADAETNLLKALEYFRLGDLKISTGQTLFFLAELKFKTQQFESGQEYLREAGMIFQEIKEYRLLAEALDLLSRIEYTFGDKEKGIEIFHSAIGAIEQTHDVKNKLKYYGKLAELYKIEEKYTDAENLNLQIMDLAAKGNDDGEYYRAVLGIVEIKKAEGKTLERNEICKKGIEKLKLALINAQRESKKARLLGDIASLYTECENYFEAKKYFSLAKEAFVALSDKGGISTSLGALAYIYALESNYKKEVETYAELKELTEDSHNYYAQAVAIFHLCKHEIDQDNFELARKYFSEVEYLNYTYSLNLEEQLEHLELILDLSTDAHTKPEKSIKELIEDFYSEVNYYPKERIHHLRLWIFCNGNELFANYKYMEGLKFLVVTDDTESFLHISSGLNAVGELFLQSFSTKFETGRSMFFHYPKERLIPKGISLVAIKGETTDDAPTNKTFSFAKKTKEEYEKEKEDTQSFKLSHTSDLKHYNMFLVEDDMSRITRQAYKKSAKEMGFEFHDYPGNIILGYPIVFPKQFEDLLLDSSSDEILKRKIFFDISDRGGREDKFRSDINLAKQLNLIPIYFTNLPKSDKIVVVETVKIDLPVFNEKAFQQHASEINKIKNLLVKFCKQIDNPKSSLQVLKIEIGETLEKFSPSTLPFEFYVLEFLSFEEKDRMLVMVLNERD